MWVSLRPFIMSSLNGTGQSKQPTMQSFFVGLSMRFFGKCHLIRESQKSNTHRFYFPNQPKFLGVFSYELKAFIRKAFLLPKMTYASPGWSSLRAKQRAQLRRALKKEDFQDIVFASHSPCYETL